MTNKVPMFYVRIYVNALGEYVIEEIREQLRKVVIDLDKIEVAGYVIESLTMKPEGNMGYVATLRDLNGKPVGNWLAVVEDVPEVEPDQL